MSESAVQRFQRRIGAMLHFAATGQHLTDQCTLALAGLARHRPFEGRSIYARLGRWLTPDLAPRITAAGGQRIALDLSRLAEPIIFEEIFVDRTYPVEQVPFTPDLVIDCGAFCGMFTLLARARFTSARFIAFEPEPYNFSRLTRNLALNAAAVEAHAAAVGVADGTVSFSGSGFGGHIAAGAEAGDITVPLVSLAGLLRRLQPQRLVLKMDVEGAEREILPDILPLLPPQTVIFIETHHEEEICQTYLQPCLNAGFGYKLIRNRMPKDMPALFIERMLVRNRPPLRHFCTYFDSHYDSMGLALYESLRRHCANFHLWVLCLDEECHQLLTRLALPGVTPIRLVEFEEGDAGLQIAKRNRSLLEYYFTCTPCLPLFLLHRHPEIDLITYLDSDLYFYSDPEPMFSALGQNSISIVAHRFAEEITHFAENGTYNVGWLSFRRDASGLACLQWWRDRCLEWCFLRHEDGRYADQKYLDQWPQLFSGVVVIPLKGANLAMWNMANHELKASSGRVTVDNEPLIFFHFHGLQRQQPWLFSLNAGFYRARLNREMQWNIIVPYLSAVLRAERAYGIFCHPGRRFALEELSARTTISQKLRYAARIVVNILRRNSVVAAYGRIFALP
ncbi:MAG: FkbM family methyltransferase [Opitutales bacterium]